MIVGSVIWLDKYYLFAVRDVTDLDKEWVNRVDLVFNESSGTEWLALKHQQINR